MFWIPDDEECWIPATFMDENVAKGISRFSTSSGRTVEVKTDRCLPIGNEQNLYDSPDDLISLSEVNEATILNAINIRFGTKQIYTACGSVLMVMNPFEIITNMYGDAQIEAYRNPYSEGLVPHIYLISSRAYSLMCSTGKNQSILISGESGAGKTESTKQCLALLTKLAQNTKAVGIAGADVGQRIIAASPILEAFGNAQTVRNPNSSRFGKWMELNFDKDNKVIGSTIISYLLEKSRLTNRDAKLERNYHIFYQILRGHSEEKLAAWRLSRQTFNYSLLAREPGVEAPNLHDEKCFEETMTGFADMGFTMEEVDGILQIVAAVLHLGDTNITPLQQGEASQIETGEDGSTSTTFLSTLLGVDADQLSYALCNKTSSAGNRKSITVKHLKPNEAADTRDSLVRNIYDRLFLDIVQMINFNNRTDAAACSRSLGLLDIFGFEIFDQNSLEQLCINYCNEMLQNHFNFVIFTAEKELYLREGIVCESIVFKDNLPIITDIENAFKALDEEAKIPKGTSKTWYDKLKNAGPAKYPCLSFPKASKVDVFNVIHYAGLVSYSPSAFLEKNVETLNNDLVQVMQNSSLPLIRRLFDSTVSPPGSRALSPAGAANSSSSSGGSAAGRKSSVAAAASSGAATVTKSISFKFQMQLQSLMEMLRATESHFVRCIKSNSKCRPLLFEATLVQKQLLYSGVFEVVKIQQSGLPIRKPHDSFLARFRCLAPSTVRWTFKQPPQLIAILKQLGYDLPNIQPGKKLTFYKGYEERILEGRRGQLLFASSVRIQSFWRCKIRRFLYRSVLDKWKLIGSELARYNLDNCKSQFNILRALISYMNKIDGFGIVEHVAVEVQSRITYLEDQLRAVKQAKELSARNTAESLDELSSLLPSWDRLNIGNHETIIACTKIITDYRNAKSFLSLFQADANNTSSFVNGSNVENLTIADISCGIDVLRTFQKILPRSVECIQAAEAHRNAIKREIEELSTRVVNCLRTENVIVDEFGNISFGTIKKEAKHTLEGVVKATNTASLVSKDARLLFADCDKILMIRNEYIPANRLEDIILLCESVESAEAIVVEQLKQLAVWAKAKLMSQSVVDFLKRGNIRFGDVSLNFEVEIEELAQQSQQLAQYQQLSAFVANIFNASKCITQLRQSLVDKAWKAFEQALEEASKLVVLQKLPEGVLEVNAARWQWEVQKQRLKLIQILTRKCFSTLSTSVVDWRGVGDTVPADEQTLAAVKEALAVNDATQGNSDNVVSASLNDLMTAAEHVLKLRKHMSIKWVVPSKPIQEDLKANYGLLFRTLGIFEHNMTEMAQCGKLIEAQEHESELDEALAACPVCADDAYTSAEFIEHSKANSKQLNLAVKKCECIADMSTVLIQKIAAAKHLVKGRELLLVYSTVDSLIAPWVTFLHDYKKAGASVSFTLSNCRSEYNAIVKELERRIIFWDFGSIICNAVVTGSIGRVVIKETPTHSTSSQNVMSSNDFGQEKFRKVSVALVQAQMTLDPKVINTLNILKQYCSDIIKIRTLISAGNYEEADVTCNQYASIFAHAADESETARAAEVIKLKEQLSLGTHHSEEFQLCSVECKYQLAVANLRRVVTQLGYSHVDGNEHEINLQSVTVDHVKKCHAALSKFSSVSAELLVLLKLSSSLIAALSPLQSRVKIFEINTHDMIQCLTLYAELKLDDKSLKVLVAYIQSQQLLAEVLAIISKGGGISDNQTSKSVSNPKPLTGAAPVENYSISKLVMRLSDPSCVIMNAPCIVKCIKLFAALESGVEAEDWLYVEQAVENLQQQLKSFQPMTVIETQVQSLLSQLTARRNVDARKAGTQAHLDVILSAGSMQTSSGGLSLAVPSHSVVIIDSFLKDTLDDRRQVKELNSMFSEAESLLGVRKQGLQLLANGWQSVHQQSKGGSDSENASPPAPARANRKSVAIKASSVSSVASSIEEANLLTGAVYFGSLIEKLERLVVQEMVVWDVDRKAPVIQNAVYNQQVETVRLITDIFPSAIDDSSLLKVLSTFHNVLGSKIGAASVSQPNSPRARSTNNAFSNNVSPTKTSMPNSSSSASVVDSTKTILDTDDPVVDASMLQKVRHLLNINTLSSQCAVVLNKQLMVLEKGAMLHEMKCLIKSGEELLVSKSFNKDLFGSLVAKLSNLGAATGGEVSIGEESAAAVKCLSIARDLCLFSAMMLPEECEINSTSMKQELSRTNSVFRRIASDWLEALPVITPVIVGINSSERIAVKQPPPLEIGKDDLRHYAECIAYMSVTGDSPEAFDGIILSCLSRFVDTIVNLVVDSYPRSSERLVVQSMCVHFDTTPVCMDSLALKNMLQYSFELMELLSDPDASPDYDALRKLIRSITHLLQSLSRTRSTTPGSQNPYCLVKTDIALNLLDLVKSLLQTPPYFMLLDLLSKYEDTIIAVYDELRLFQCVAGVSRAGINMQVYNPNELSLWVDVAVAKAVRQEMLKLMDQYNEDPRIVDIAADLKFLIEIIEKIQAGQIIKYSPQQCDQVLQAADAIRLASRGRELDSICVSHRLVADYVYRFIYCCGIEQQELGIRTRLLSFLEKDRSDALVRNEIVQEIERNLVVISSKPLLRDVFPSYEGLLLWRAICLSNITNGSTAKILVDIASYFKFSEDGDCRVDKIMQQLLKVDENRRAANDILHFIRNRKQTTFSISDTALAASHSKASAASLKAVINALKNFRSLDFRHPQLATVDVLSVVHASIPEFSRHTVHIMLQELSLLLVRVEEGKSDDFFTSFTTSIRNRAVTLPTVQQFFASSDTSALYDSSKALNSSQLKILWKDSEILCLLCDMVTQRSSELAPFEVKKAINLLQTASPEFSSLAAEAEQLSTLKFYFALLIKCCQRGTRLSFAHIDVPALSQDELDLDLEETVTCIPADEPESQPTVSNVSPFSAGTTTAAALFAATDTKERKSISAPQSKEQNAFASYLKCFRIICRFHETFEDIRDQCLLGYNFEYILRESKQLIQHLKIFIPKLLSYGLPSWLVTVESISQVLVNLLTECEKIVMQCETEMFRSLVTNAMNPLTAASVHEEPLFQTLGTSEPTRDPLAKALGEYLLSKTLLLMSNTQTVMPSTSSAAATRKSVTLPDGYLTIHNSKRVSKDGLIYRANLLYLLREAVRKENWLASEAEKNKANELLAAQDTPAVPMNRASSRRASVNYHQSANVPARRVSVAMPAPTATSTRSVRGASMDLTLDSSVQAIVQQWYTTVEFPDIWDGSAEFRTAYEELRNRMLFDALIKHATLGEHYDPCKVLQITYTDIGYVRPANINSVVSRLDLHIDLMTIEKLNSLWALEILTPANVNHVLTSSKSKGTYTRKSSMNSKLLQPITDSQSESSEAVVQLYRKLCAAYDLIKSLSGAINGSAAVTPTTTATATTSASIDVAKLNEMINEIHALTAVIHGHAKQQDDNVSEIVGSESVVTSGTAANTMDLLLKQLSLLSYSCSHTQSNVSSDSFINTLSCVQNWNQWDDSVWAEFELNTQLTLKLAEFRSTLASQRRSYMLRNFISFYLHEASDIYLNLSDMLTATFGEEAENTWQERGEVMRAKLSRCFHIDKYFSDIIAVHHSESQQHVPAEAGGMPSNPLSVDCQLFHLQQILDSEPKCRGIMANAQTLKRVKDKVTMDTWTENKQELRSLMQTHIDNDLWLVLTNNLHTVETELTLQKVLDEIDQDIDVSMCKCRFEIANVLSQAVVRISNLSLACVALYQQSQNRSQQTLPSTGSSASRPVAVVNTYSMTHNNIETSRHSNAPVFTTELLQTIEWTLNMRLAVLTEDWTMVDQLDDVFMDMEKMITEYSPFGSTALRSLSVLLMKHSSALERLQNELGAGVQQSVEGNQEEELAYFYFIDANALENAVTTSLHIEFSTEELRCLLGAARFTLDLLRAIEADFWFDSTAVSATPTDAAEDIKEKRGLEQNVQEPKDERLSVAQLLQQERPGIYTPRAVIIEIDRVEREFQNQQVEVRLVHALLTGRDYLRQTENFENINTEELQEVVDLASSLRVRSLRNSKLFDAATKILHLRHAVKLGDWVAIRYCLFEASKSAIVPEAEYELKELMLISEERNHRMHLTVTDAIKHNRVGGSYMKLDATNVDAMPLLAALRGAINVPKISHEDKQLIYSAEKLKNIRISILMSDYDRLVSETASADLSMICSEALEEMLLVKKAIDFFQNIKQVNAHLLQGRCGGTPGHLETQQLSIYQLSNSLAAFHLSECEVSVKQFLACGLVMRDLRAATKGARWGTVELSNLLISYVLRQRELVKTIEVRREQYRQQQLLQQQRKRTASGWSNAGDNDDNISTARSLNNHSTSSQSLGRRRSMTVGGRGHSNSKSRSSTPVDHNSSQQQENNNSSNITFEEEFLEQYQQQRDADAREHFGIDFNQVKVVVFDYQHELFGNVIMSNPHSSSTDYRSDSNNAANSAAAKNSMRRPTIFGLNDMGGAGSSASSRESSMDAYPYDMIRSVAYSSSSSRVVLGDSDDNGDDDNHDTRRQQQQQHGQSNLLGLPQYKDIPAQYLHTIEMLNHSSMDPLCLPRLLGSMTFVVDSVEAEVVLLRDEVYNRVCIHVLRRGLAYQSLFTEAIHYGGDDTTTADGGGEAAGSANVASSSSTASSTPLEAIDLDAAIEVVCMLGCKSKDALRLLHTAYFMRKLRAAVNIAHISSAANAVAEMMISAQSAKETLGLLGQVWEMKSNGLFDPIAVAEVDDVFHLVCSTSLKDEIYSKLKIYHNYNSSNVDINDNSKRHQQSLQQQLSQQQRDEDEDTVDGLLRLMNTNNSRHNSVVNKEKPSSSANDTAGDTVDNIQNDAAAGSGGISLRALKKSMRKLASFKNPDQESSLILSLCATLLKVKDAARCGVVQRMQTSIINAQSQLQSPTLLQLVSTSPDGVCPCPRLSALVARVQREVDVLTMTWKDLNETIVKQADAVTALRSNNNSPRVASGRMDPLEVQEEDEETDVFATDKMLVRGGAGSGSGHKYAANLMSDAYEPADEIKQEFEARAEQQQHTLANSLRCILSIIKTAILHKADDETVAVQIGGRLDTLLKSVLSSEEPSHTCGDIDSTVVRVLCTLLLIEVYLGTPEMPESPAAQAAAAARAQRLKGKDGGGGDVQDPVVVEVKVEIFRKGLEIVEHVLDKKHKEAQAEAARLKTEVTAKYFNKRASKAAATKTGSTSTDDVFGYSFNPQARCGTAALSAVGAVLEQLIKLVVKSPKHFVETENSLLMLSSHLSKSDRELTEALQQTQTRSTAFTVTSSGHTVLTYALKTLAEVRNRATWRQQRMKA